MGSCAGPGGTRPLSHFSLSLQPSPGKFKGRTTSCLPDGRLPVPSPLGPSQRHCPFFPFLLWTYCPLPMLLTLILLATSSRQPAQVSQLTERSAPFFSCAAEAALSDTRRQDSWEGTRGGPPPPPGRRSQTAAQDGACLGCRRGVCGRPHGPPRGPAGWRLHGRR